MNENIDLTKILKDCPSGTKLYSPIFGDVIFERIDVTNDYPIRIKCKSEKVDDWMDHVCFTKKGFFLNRMNAECTLFYSRDQRDWNKFKAPWYKKERFDPNTLNPFDRVICQNGIGMWRCDFFSSYIETYVYKYACIGSTYEKCIPYNDDTKHLLGTIDKAPEYYRYWED